MLGISTGGDRRRQRHITRGLVVTFALVVAACGDSEATEDRPRTAHLAPILFDAAGNAVDAPELESGPAGRLFAIGGTDLPADVTVTVAGEEVEYHRENGALATFLPVQPELPATVDVVVSDATTGEAVVTRTITIEPPEPPPGDYRAFIQRFIDAARSLHEANAGDDLSAEVMADLEILEDVLPVMPDTEAFGIAMALHNASVLPMLESAALAASPATTWVRSLDQLARDRGAQLALPALAAAPLARPPGAGPSFEHDTFEDIRPTNPLSLKWLAQNAAKYLNAPPKVEGFVQRPGATQPSLDGLEFNALTWLGIQLSAQVVGASDIHEAQEGERYRFTCLAWDGDGIAGITSYAVDVSEQGLATARRSDDPPEISRIAGDAEWVSNVDVRYPQTGDLEGRTAFNQPKVVTMAREWETPATGTVRVVTFGCSATDAPVWTKPRTTTENFSVVILEERPPEVEIFSEQQVAVGHEFDVRIHARDPRDPAGIGVPSGIQEVVLYLDDPVGVVSAQGPGERGFDTDLGGILVAEFPVGTGADRPPGLGAVREHILDVAGHPSSVRLSGVPSISVSGLLECREAGVAHLQAVAKDPYDRWASEWHEVRCLSPLAADGLPIDPDRPPVVTELGATLAIPATTYFVQAFDGAGGDLSYEWRMTGDEFCGSPMVPWTITITSDETRFALTGGGTMPYEGPASYDVHGDRGITGSSIRWSHGDQSPDDCTHDTPDHTVSVSVTITSSASDRSVQCLTHGSLNKRTSDWQCFGDD